MGRGAGWFLARAAVDLYWGCSSRFWESACMPACKLYLYGRLTLVDLQ